MTSVPNSLFLPAKKLAKPSKFVVNALNNTLTRPKIEHASTGSHLIRAESYQKMSVDLEEEGRLHEEGMEPSSSRSSVQDLELAVTQKRGILDRGLRPVETDGSKLTPCGNQSISGVGGMDQSICGNCGKYIGEHPGL